MARKITALKARSRYKARLLIGMVFQPLRLFCDECDNYVPSDMVWHCGHCAEINRNTRYYSFLNKCQNCKRPPKSFVCPHCTMINFLDRDFDDSHPARSAGLPPVVIPTKDAIRAEKREARIDEKEDLNHQIEVAKLNADLAKYKESKKNGREKLNESFLEHESMMLGVDEIVRDARERYKTQFANDLDGLARANEWLDDWADRKRI